LEISPPSAPQRGARRDGDGVNGGDYLASYG
jgi:hypothetical protein